MKAELQGDDKESNRAMRIKSELTQAKELLDDHKKREDMQKLIKQLQVNMMPENQGESRERASRYQSEINQGKIEEYKRRRKLRYAQSVGGAGSVGQAQTMKARPKTAIGASVQVAMLKDNWNSLRDQKLVGVTPNMSPCKQGLINLDLLQKDIRKSMRYEEMANPDPVVAKFNS